MSADYLSGRRDAIREIVGVTVGPLTGCSREAARTYADHQARTAALRSDFARGYDSAVEAYASNALDIGEITLAARGRS